jgi:ring-1,2-phenylacetyl-CoA epoxidase subunit PaaD
MVTSVVAQALDLVGNLPDPEIPVLTLQDLGILRDVFQDEGRLVVTLTPTYIGCPAMHAIRVNVIRALRGAGFDRADVRIVLTPPWTTDWITDEARAKLRAYGIAPPRPAKQGGCALVAAPVECPRCGSENTWEVSRFGSTPCQAHLICRSCLEPFDRFKEL